MTSATSVRTVQGLCHVQLAVSDLAAARRFYEQIFGLRLHVSEGDDFVILKTPGYDDSLALKARVPGKTAGESAGVLHIGFHVADEADVELACQLAVRLAGGVDERGRHPRGEFYAYLRDPDGYLVEVSGPPTATH
jgi:catechol 2,3-dioxygenase-like lactoylglutathione lyase family enzyme